VTKSVVAPSDFVIPAKAGIQTKLVPGTDASWIPAFAGMTGEAGKAAQ
jgi:hypothetical protein